MSKTLEKAVEKKSPKSVALMAKDGIQDSRKCANVLGAIALDVLTSQITPQVGNTACNAIGKMLKVKELEIKYGLSDGPGAMKRLELTD